MPTLNKPVTMEELMASLGKKTLRFERGAEVKGVVVSVGDSEVVVDLGTKNEGVINLKEIISDPKPEFNVGDEINAFVVLPETPSGQTLLSLQPVSLSEKRSSRRGVDPKKWQKFTQALNSKSELKGTILEQNKGGYVVEVERVRGFLPSSQLSLAVLKEGSDLYGKESKVWVIEEDLGANKLIFSTYPPLTEKQLQVLQQFKEGERAKGRVAGVTNFGVYLDLDGPPGGEATPEAGEVKVEGLIKSQDLSWERLEDLNSQFKVGEELEAQVTGKDTGLGRVNLSLKVLTEDPFAGLAKSYQVDDVVSGTVAEVTDKGIRVTLKDGIEGFIPLESVTVGNQYSLGQTTNFLVSEVDNRRRQIVLAPFLTSTTGLLYR